MSHTIAANHQDEKVCTAVQAAKKGCYEEAVDRESR